MLIFSSILNDSRSVDRYELSALIKNALALKGITAFLPLQEYTVQALVGQPKPWYIERPDGITNQRILEFVGPEKPKNLKEGEKAFQPICNLKARQDVICLAEIGQSILSLRT